jgi:hypothetical protein
MLKKITIKFLKRFIKNFTYRSDSPTTFKLVSLAGGGLKEGDITELFLFLVTT